MSGGGGREEREKVEGKGKGGKGKGQEKRGKGRGERRGNEKEKKKRGGESYYMNSPRSSRKVKEAKRMNMPREAVSHLSGKQRVIDQVYCRLLHECQSVPCLFFSRTCCVV